MWDGSGGVRPRGCANPKPKTDASCPKLETVEMRCREGTMELQTCVPESAAGGAGVLHPLLRDSLLGHLPLATRVTPFAGFGSPVRRQPMRTFVMSPFPPARVYLWTSRLLPLLHPLLSYLRVARTSQHSANTQRLRVSSPSRVAGSRRKNHLPGGALDLFSPPRRPIVAAVPSVPMDWVKTHLNVRVRQALGV